MCSLVTSILHSSVSPGLGFMYGGAGPRCCPCMICPGMIWPGPPTWPSIPMLGFICCPGGICICIRFPAIIPTLNKYARGNEEARSHSNCSYFLRLGYFKVSHLDSFYFMHETRTCDVPVPSFEDVAVVVGPVAGPSDWACVAELDVAGAG